MWTTICSPEKMSHICTVSRFKPRLVDKKYNTVSDFSESEMKASCQNPLKSPLSYLAIHKNSPSDSSNQLHTNLITDTVKVVIFFSIKLKNPFIHPFKTPSNTLLPEPCHMSRATYNRKRHERRTWLSAREAMLTSLTTRPKRF